MITIRKLKTLKPGTLRRKTAVIFRAFEEDLMQNRAVDEIYLAQLIELTMEAFSGSDEIVAKAGAAQRAEDADSSLRLINSLRNRAGRLGPFGFTQPRRSESCRQQPAKQQSFSGRIS